MVERSSNISAALNSMAETSRSMLAVSAMIELVIAVIFIGIALAVYFKKLKGQEKREMLWIIAAACLGLIGFLFLIGFIFSLVTYMAAPAVINSLVSP